MINKILDKYYSRYDCADKILFIYEPILVSELIRLNSIKDIKIRIIDRRSK